MASVIEQYLTPIRNILQSKEYREFLRLFFKYKNFPRSQKQRIEFLNYDFQAVDVLSFIFQYKHIFVNQMYRFQTNSPLPVIYDCGANVGLSCLYYKKQFPKAKIKAFEADPDIAAVLTENMKKNNVGDVEVIAKALWKDNNGVQFTADSADGGSLFIDGDKILVPSVRLRDLISSEDRIDMIKMNVEGAELDLILDCSDVLYKAENLYIEYHSFTDRKQELDKILNVLTENGFRYYIQNVISSSGPAPLASELSVDNLDLQLHIFAYKRK
ncbi:MAG: FkbM family methyltransferase [Bacillota bacterium]